MADPKKEEGLSPQMQQVYEHLKKVRASTTVSLKPCPLLRENIQGLNGQLEPFSLRYYQVQGTYHMMRLKRMVLGDDCGLGKTPQSIAALCYLWDTSREAGNRVIVVAPKSAIQQWADEIRRFTKDVRVIVVPSGAKHGVSAQDRRIAAYNEWADAPANERVVLVLNYALLVRDWYQGSFQPPGKDGKPDPKAPVLPGLLDKVTAKVGRERLVVILDECTAFKSKRTKTWEVCYFLAARSHRVYGLTATLLKNRLFEGYCIFGVIRPGIFTTQKAFHDDFCFVELKKIGKARVPIIKGYKNLDKFREKIDPYFLGRKKHMVATELPTLTTREVLCELSPAEDTKYEEALNGILELGDGEVKVYEENKALVSLIYCQQVVNSLSMLRFKEGDHVSENTLDFDFDVKGHKIGAGAKEQALVDLLTGELEDEKVIVYTRFESLVGRLQTLLKKEGVKSTRITGKENDTTRRSNQKVFQDPSSDTNVIFITDAGSEAINLQAAIGMIFFDSPWSWGAYIQCLDTATEILTHRGFLGYAEIRSDDIVAAFDPFTEVITWQPIRSKVLRSLGADEKMYALCSPHMDIRVTGGHRMLFQRQTSDKHKRKIWPNGWRIQTAQDLSCEKSVYRIPVSGVERTPGLLVTDAELRFIGWFLTDGGFNKATGQVQITQAVHQPQIEDLRRCLADCGFDWKEYPREPSCIKGSFPNGRPQIVFVIPKGTGQGSNKRNGWVRLAPYLDKDFSPALEALDSRQLGVLLEAIHLGDGDKQLGQSWTRRSYHISTGSKVFADRLQSLCVRRGYRCNISKPKGYKLHIKRGLHWTLMGAPSQKRPRLVATPTTPGEKVWCVENDVGTLITRRNGKVAIVGNCLGRMIRIGSPHKGVLAFHLITERPKPEKDDRKTIDHHVLTLLRKKKGLIDKVLGEGAVGALTFDKSGTDLQDLVRAMQSRQSDGV